MSSLSKELDNLISDWFENLELPKQPAGLYNPIRYAMTSGGKRLRPTLLLAAVKAFNGNLESARNQCIGIEMFHNFTLLHDDVMDNSDVRRGQLTVHRRWNNNTAILSGDTMLTIATQCIAECPSGVLPRVLETFNTTAIQVYEGQQLDMDYEERKDVTVDEYLEMIKLKTSVLLACALKIGAILAGADEIDTDALYEYGIKIGLGFQLRDDYLDTFGDPLIFGKQIGGDILNEKKTWLMITAQNEDKDGKLGKALNESANEDEKVQNVTAIYKDLNLDSRILDLIRLYSEEAIQIAEKLNITSEAKEYFISLANELINRSH